MWKCANCIMAEDDDDDDGEVLDCNTSGMLHQHSFFLELAELPDA